MNRKFEQRMMNAALKTVENPPFVQKFAERDEEVRQLLIDVGRLLTQNYDQAWLEQQRVWLETYRRGA